MRLHELKERALEAHRVAEERRRAAARDNLRRYLERLSVEDAPDLEVAEISPGVHLVGRENGVHLVLRTERGELLQIPVGGDLAELGRLLADALRPYPPTAGPQFPAEEGVKRGLGGVPPEPIPPKEPPTPEIPDKGR